MRVLFCFTDYHGLNAGTAYIDLKKGKLSEQELKREAIECLNSLRPPGPISTIDIYVHVVQMSEVESDG